MGASQLNHSVFQVSLCLGLFFTSAFPKHVLTSAVRLSLLISSQGNPRKELPLSNLPPHPTNTQTQHTELYLLNHS